MNDEIDAAVDEVVEAAEPEVSAEIPGEPPEAPEVIEKNPLDEPIMFRKDGVHVGDVKVPGVLANSFTIRTVDGVRGKVPEFWAIDLTLYTNVEPEFDEMADRVAIHVKESSDDSVTYEVSDYSHGIDSETVEFLVSRLRRDAVKQIPGSLRRPCSRCENPCRPDAEKCPRCGESLAAA